MGIITKEKLIESLGEVRSAAFKYAADMQFIINEVEKINDDTVDVIRCKDCKYFERRSIYCHGLCDVHCNGIGEKEVTSEDQYCSWAERKEE